MKTLVLAWYVFSGPSEWGVWMRATRANAICYDCSECGPVVCGVVADKETALPFADIVAHCPARQVPQS